MNADAYVTCDTQTLAPALVKGAQYYAFKNGDNYFYVSSFDRQSAHTGCFQAKHFTEVAPPNEETQLQAGETYTADLITTEGQYPGTEYKSYYVIVGETHGRFYEYNQHERGRFCGQFPLAWFTGFEKVAEKEQAPELQPNDKIDPVFATEPIFEQMSLF